MDQTEAIETLVGFLMNQTSAPVRVSGMEDERPVPLIKIEDWNATDFTWHNTAFAGQAVDPEDGVEKRWYRFYYSLRVEIVVRHSDTVEAHRLLDEVRHALSMVRENPGDFHPHLNELKLRGSRGINHKFLESKETELAQAVLLDTFHEVKRSDFDSIESIENDFTFR